MYTISDDTCPSSNAAGGVSFVLDGKDRRGAHCIKQVIYDTHQIHIQVRFRGES
jgi:hypothetical protein